MTRSTALRAISKEKNSTVAKTATKNVTALAQSNENGRKGEAAGHQRKKMILNDEPKPW